MDQDSDIHLRWNHHQTTLLSVFSSLLGNENLVDCTISAEGQYFKAHRVILSACSPYFELIFSEHCKKHPIVILPDVKFQILKVLMEYMYSGEVKVPQNNLSNVLELADALQIKGLTSTADSEIKDDLRTKRRNESLILGDQQGFTKPLRKSRYGSQVKQKDVSSVHTTEKKCSEDIDSLLLDTHKFDNNCSKFISSQKIVEEPAVSQDITDSQGFNVLQCFSLPKTPCESNTHVSGTLMNSVFNILDSNQLPGSSKETIVGQRMLSENVLLSPSTSEELRTSEPLGMSGETADVVLLPEIKQENPYDSADVNSGTVGGNVMHQETVNGQGFCSLEQYRDTYFVEPSSVTPNLFKCETCGKSYRYNSGLWRHLKYECGKEPQFRCPQCPAKFIHKHHLRKHFLRTHLPY